MGVCEVNLGVYKVNVGNTKLMWPAELMDESVKRLTRFRVNE